MVSRAAIIGCGFWAQFAHVPAIRALPGVALVACVGKTTEEAQTFAATQQIEGAFDSIEELLDSPLRPDLFIVAAPDDVHPIATRQAMEAGVAVFCEKPLANSAATALELAGLARTTSVPATVGYSFRYSPAIQALRADLLSGVLGEPWLIELFEYNAQFHPLTGKPMNWKGDPQHAAAGALFEYGSHAVDLANWLVGPVARVSANLARVLPGALLDDIATLQLDFEGPTVGILVASWVLAGSIPGIRTRIHGSGGSAEVELSETVTGGQAYRRLRLDGSVGEEVALEPLGELGPAYARRHLSDFIAAIRGGASPYSGTLPTLAEGARVQLILEAAMAATESWIAMPKVTSVSRGGPEGERSEQ